jgi:hypothetical protein
VEQIAAAVQGELPAWASVFATLLLAVAAAIARRISRRSARPQGERLGLLEQEFALERTRRRQLEDVLWQEGIDLPPWPPDGIPRRAPRPPEPSRDDVDQADDVEPATTRSPAIPPLPAYPQHRR